MNERFPDCVTMIEQTPTMRVAIVAVEDEVRGIQALYACLRRQGMERVILGVQPVSKGGKKMSERSMDCLTATDHIPAKRATILLVEDEECVRLPLHSFLQIHGYEIIAVETVEEAEQCITERGSENISAIVSDINLHPDSKEPEGYAFFQRWSAEHPDLPFILISGDPSSWDLPDVRSGTLRFLAKPFDVYDLLAAVRSVLRE